MIQVAVIRDSVSSTRITKKEIQNTVSVVCRGEKVKDAELSFVIVNDKKIRTINKRFLDHDYVTDVITFPLEEKRISAEIYINVQQAIRQAKQYGVTSKNEMIRLVVHGTLHALGYDDTKKKERELMLTVQEQYVSKIK